MEVEVPVAGTLLICVVWVVAVRGALFSPVFLERQEPIATVTSPRAKVRRLQLFRQPQQHFSPRSRPGTGNLSLCRGQNPTNEANERHGDGELVDRGDPHWFCMEESLSHHCSRNWSGNSKFGATAKDGRWKRRQRYAYRIDQSLRR